MIHLRGSAGRNRQRETNRKCIWNMDLERKESWKKLLIFQNISRVHGRHGPGSLQVVDNEETVVRRKVKVGEECQAGRKQEVA